MNNDPQVTILMATYNGERFIRHQIDSILAQTYSNWKIIVRDDGSKDKTVDIVKEYISNNNISIIINNSGIKGACPNFAALFSIAQQDTATRYIMFCDQDDIWKPEKIELSLKAIQLMENTFPNQPVLIYGNFELMSSDGNYVPGEFKLKQKLQLKNLLSFNYVYGCTTILNRQLIERINTIPNDAINHDYWVALVASLYQSKYLPDKLLRYRQHNSNASGNVEGNNSIASRLKRNLLSPDKEIVNLAVRLNMFGDFYDNYKNDLSVSNQKILTDYLGAFKKGRINVCYIMLRDKIFRKGLFQTLASFAQVLFFFNKIQADNISGN